MPESLDSNRRKVLEANRQRGLEAELFLQYLEREPYFKQLFQELDTGYVNALLVLDPKNTGEFTVLQAKRLSLYEPLNRVQQDIQVGRKASEEMELLDRGEQSKEGIL